MKKKKVLIGIAGFFVLAAALTSITVTKQNEYKLIRQFGKVQRVIDKPGSAFDPCCRDYGNFAETDSSL